MLAKASLFRVRIWSSTSSMVPWHLNDVHGPLVDGHDMVCFRQCQPLFPTLIEHRKATIPSSDLNL